LEVAAPLVRTRRAIAPRRPGSSLLEIAHRLEASELLALQGAFAAFRPALLLPRLSALAALAVDLAQDAAAAEALALDVADILLRQARIEGRRSFTWCEPGGRVREVEQVVLPARGGTVLDLAAGVIRPGGAEGEAVLALASDFSPIAAEARA
jgi:hypothetical protein